MRPVRLLSAAAALAATALLAATPLAQGPAGPRLLVIAVVDQMRDDYLERFAPLYAHGFKRLLTEGAVFTENYYPYLNTVTCVGHATIGSGTLPSTHGIILNAWWHGTRVASCTDDASVSSVGYAEGAEAIGHSASQLLAPSIGDRLRERSPDSRVVTLSIKPRSAVMLAGHGGTVLWRDDKNVWATSTAFATGPDAGLQALLAARPVSADRAEVWSRVAPAAAYTHPDDGVAEAAPAGWSAVFPHPLAGAPGTPDGAFDTLWETSPYADAYLGRVAAGLVKSMQLGQRGAVDYLGISFSALDYVGHAFGPDSQEVEDTLLRLDATLGTLFDALDATVGRDNYVVGLSADHGVAPIPEARVRAGLDGGRIMLDELTMVADRALAAGMGEGRHVVRTDYTQMYFTDDARRRAAANPALVAPAIAALEAEPGVLRVLRGAGLEKLRDSTDPVVRAAALSHYPGRSGDLVVIPKPNYLLGSASGTTHGTLHPYDQHVPLVFMGAGVKAGRYREPSTPADLAPTLASIVALPMPGADGQARTSAIRRH